MRFERAPISVGEAFRPPEDAAPARKRNRLALREYVGAKAYSLTLATADRQPWFRDGPVASHCLDMLKETSALTQIEVYAYCFMPDHVHLLVGSGEDGADLIDFVKRFKQKTGWWSSNRYVPSGSLKASPTDPAAAKRSIGLWQKSYYDHIVRSNENLRAAAEYIIANPVQAGLTREPGEYPFAGSFVWPDIYQR